MLANDEQHQFPLVTITLQPNYAMLIVLKAFIADILYSVNFIYLHL